MAQLVILEQIATQANVASSFMLYSNRLGYASNHDSLKRRIYLDILVSGMHDFRVEKGLFVNMLFLPHHIHLDDSLKLVSPQPDPLEEHLCRLEFSWKKMDHD